MIISFFTVFSILATDGSKPPGWDVWGSQPSVDCWLDNFHVTWLKKKEKMTVTCAQCPHFLCDSVRINKRACAGGWRCQQSSKWAAAGGVCVCVCMCADWRLPWDKSSWPEPRSAACMASLPSLSPLPLPRLACLPCALSHDLIHLLGCTPHSHLSMSPIQKATGNSTGNKGFCEEAATAVLTGSNRKKGYSNNDWHTVMAHISTHSHSLK